MSDTATTDAVAQQLPTATTETAVVEDVISLSKNVAQYDQVEAEEIDVTGDGGVLKKIIQAAPADAKGPPLPGTMRNVKSHSARD